MKAIAIIGPTASGKSDAALELAQKINADILSIDSLSIYKQIDIASAKPSKEERLHVKHFGIDELYPNEPFSVATFIALYNKAQAECKAKGKNLIIVGGTSFYLKSLLTGLSDIPKIAETTRQKTEALLSDLAQAYGLLESVDPAYMHAIKPNDRYRIEKMLHLYLETGEIPSVWFAAHPPKPIIADLNIYNIAVERDLLRSRIATRTQKMLTMGLIDEVAMLEHAYGRAPNSMKAIGIVEVLEYFDGLTCKATMLQNIITHTAQLAKRQQTFNQNQFDTLIHVSAETLPSTVLRQQF